VLEEKATAGMLYGAWYWVLICGSFWEDRNMQQMHIMQALIFVSIATLVLVIVVVGIISMVQWFFREEDYE